MTKLSRCQLMQPVLAAIARLSEREKLEIIKRLEAKQNAGMQENGTNITRCNHAERSANLERFQFTPAPKRERKSANPAKSCKRSGGSV